MPYPKLSKKGSDYFQTPEGVIDPLLPYLSKDWIIWEPAYGKGNLLRAFTNTNFTVIGTDIEGGWNFFEDASVPKKIDCIITNPPFSLKNHFIKRCYELQKPFALLLPIVALESKKRQDLWKNGLQILFFPKRIAFETPSGKKSSPWLATAWFTYGLNLPKELNFT